MCISMWYAYVVYMSYHWTVLTAAHGGVTAAAAKSNRSQHFKVLTSRPKLHHHQIRPRNVHTHTTPAMKICLRLNKTPTWCNKMQILLLQTLSTCSIPNMAEWGSTCNHNYLYRWLPCQYFILMMMGAWRPKHVEKVYSNKICILLHHVGVLFNLVLWCTETQN